ncbi:hypothetical protein [Marinobacter sp. X15-166B]|uniref:hypothetical protein n=1 Tax=Marinobacter sp. X15-166B TaxID=1897620 RepID=UPI00114D3A70|nr:hypothetical protein [Marinobacter sp. X15-166B]
MKTKMLTLGFVVVTGFVMLLSAAVVRTPSGSQAMAQVCQADPMQCVVPQNLSAFPLRPW